MTLILRPFRSWSNLGLPALLAVHFVTDFVVVACSRASAETATSIRLGLNSSGTALDFWRNPVRLYRKIRDRDDSVAIEGEVMLG